MRGFPPQWVYDGHVRNLDFFIIQIDRIRYVLSSYTRTRIEKVGSCIFLSLQAWVGWAKYKKNLCKRKLREKFSCTASSPEKSSCTQKKYSCKGNVQDPSPFVKCKATGTTIAAKAASETTPIQIFHLEEINILSHGSKGQTIRKVMCRSRGRSTKKFMQRKAEWKIHTQRVAQKKSSCIRKKNIFLQGKC